MLKMSNKIKVGDLVRQKSRTIYEYHGVRTPSIYYDDDSDLFSEQKLSFGTVLSVGVQEITNKKICSVLWITEDNKITTNEFMENLCLIEKGKHSKIKTS